MLWSAKKRFYRAYQGVMKVAANVLPFPVPVLLTGPGSVGKLAENISVRGHKKILVVSDKVLVELKLVERLLGALCEQGIDYVVFDEVEPNPTIESIEAGKKLYRAQGCDAIVAFGGGSAIDCAKIIGARVANPYLPVRAMEGLFRVVLPIPPFYCVPTTAGTGSEATIVAVITDAKTHEKFVISDLKLIPKIAVLDPALMAGLPPALTATTGMDALTHAIEAYIGLNGSAFTDANAQAAARLIFAHLEEAYQNGANLQARMEMARASFFAGAAFTRAYVGYVHAIAHGLGGLYGVPHGLANAICLPPVLEFCRRDAEPKLAALAVESGLGDRSESAQVLSGKLIAQIKAMNQRMQIPQFVSELREQDIPLLARRALDEAHPSYPVPTIMTRQECEALLRRLLPR